LIILVDVENEFYRKKYTGGVFLYQLSDDDELNDGLD
jgi:hypothetical protein